MQRIDYVFDQRDTAMAEIFANGLAIVHDTTTDIDADGKPATCYFMVVDAPPPAGPSAEELLAQADMTILDLMEQLILIQEGL